MAQFAQEIAAIAADNRLGAAEILTHAARVFSHLRQEAGQAQDITRAEARRIVSAIAAGLLDAHPDMAPLANLVSAVIERMGQVDTSIVKEAAAAAEDFVRHARQAVENAAIHGAELVQDGVTLMTHSRSSTVLQALGIARRDGRNFTVIATESRPVMEGKVLAESLAARGLSVSFIADATAAAVMDRVDLVIVGADTITPSSVVNKVGTVMIALAAREHGVPVYAIADTTKFTSNPEPASRDPHRGDELWIDPPHGVTVLNRYYEAAPLHLFEKIVTEDGPLDPKQASERAAGSKVAAIPEHS